MDQNKTHSPSSKAKIVVVSDEGVLSYEVDHLPYDLKDLSGVEDCPINFCCSNSHCGTCLIKIIEGREFIDPPTQNELKMLASLGASDNERLACGCLVRGDIKIEPIMV